MSVKIMRRVNLNKDETATHWRYRGMIQVLQADLEGHNTLKAVEERRGPLVNAFERKLQTSLFP